MCEDDHEQPRANDLDRLKSLENGELHTAYEFQTEGMELFQLKRIDGELDAAWLPAMKLILELDETGEWSPCGIAVAGLLKFMRGHPRAFGRYFDGPDMPYPRPSNVIQAEMDRLMPDYVSYLKDEMELALEEEASAANSGP